MYRFVQRGQSVLENSAEPPKKSAKTIVRIYYVSEGDETLYVDSEPLTYQAAEALANHCTPTKSTAARVQRYAVGETPVLWKSNARGIVLPSAQQEASQDVLT